MNGFTETLAKDLGLKPYSKEHIRTGYNCFKGPGIKATTVSTILRQTII